jgi:hypothetical protein
MTMTAIPSVVRRGTRKSERIDFATADWRLNEFGVGVLSLSLDSVSGAETFALRCPANFIFPEDAHFYDCEQELFQFVGNFHHDEIAPYQAGDYIYRPIGTVYGHGEGSTHGGIIIASLARERRRYLLAENPYPWTGHYLVDRLWNPRAEQPLVLPTSDLPWQADSSHPGLSLRKLRGLPGVIDPVSGASAHSPWASDAAFILRIPGGFSGPFPVWPGFALEILVLGGRATVAGEPWHRGCYGFDALAGACEVSETLDIYVRSFAMRA